MEKCDEGGHLVLAGTVQPPLAKSLRVLCAAGALRVDGYRGKPIMFQVIALGQKHTSAPPPPPPPPPPPCALELRGLASFPLYY